MAFKYINPGFADLFDEVSVNCNQYYNNANSRTSGDCFNVPGNINTLYLERSKEYWVAMVDLVFSNDSYTLTIIKDTTASNNAIYVNSCIKIENYKIDDNRFTFQLKDKGNNIIYKDSKALYYKRMYHFEFYIKDDPINGEINVWVDGELFLEYKGSTGTGNGYNRLELSTTDSVYSYEYISDFVVQNTGRIGNVKVSSVPYKVDVGICEWNINYPVGYTMIPQYINGNTRTYIFTNNMFELAGKVESIRVSQGGTNSAVFKFCIFRKNASTNKYNAIQTTKELKTSQEGVQELILEIPLIIEPGDYLGFYSLGNNHCYRLDNACSVFEANDKTNAQEIEIPTPTYNCAPCVHAIFIPDDKIVGYKKAVEIQSENRELGQYVNFLTNTVDKSLLCMLDLSHIKAGSIDSIAITNNAKYDGESQVRGLAAVIKDDTNNYESSSKAISTSYKNLSLVTLDKSPITGKEWSKSELQNIKLGIKSKA